MFQMLGPLLPHAENPLGANYLLADAVLWFPYALNLGNFRAWALMRDFISVMHRLWCRGSTFIGTYILELRAVWTSQWHIGLWHGNTQFFYLNNSAQSTLLRSHVAQSVWSKYFQCCKSFCFFWEVLLTPKVTTHEHNFLKDYI